MARTTEKLRTVLFSVDVLEELAPHAARRGMTANELARQLVSTVVDEGMVDAVMDDGEVTTLLRGAA